ncbi:MAG: amino acid transporter [Microbacteriaceae bacterium]|nr:amino acid transporter [Microbacteriaceae bacterium]
MFPSVLAALAGAGFGLSLIVAIGAQNAFVLRQGLRREHVFTIVAICALSDALLIVLGVLGLGSLIAGVPVVLNIIEIAGGLFLVTYGVLAAKRAVKPGELTTDPSGAPLKWGAAVATVLALTYLNPHVYLDTVLLLGSVAGTYGDNRWWFAAGAAMGSIVWFSALGFGARLLRPVFAKPVAWRILDAVIAVVMCAIGLSLLWSFAQHVFGW